MSSTGKREKRCRGGEQSGKVWRVPSTGWRKKSIEASADDGAVYLLTGIGVTPASGKDIYFSIAC